MFIPKVPSKTQNVIDVFEHNAFLFPQIYLYCQVGIFHLFFRHWESTLLCAFYSVITEPHHPHIKLQPAYQLCISPGGKSGPYMTVGVKDDLVLVSYMLSTFLISMILSLGSMVSINSHAWPAQLWASPAKWMKLC